MRGISAIVLMVSIFFVAACSEGDPPSTKTDEDIIAADINEFEVADDAVADSGDDDARPDGGAADGDAGEADGEDGTEADVVLPGNPVGGECADGSDCRTSFCYAYPLGGYCTLFCTSDEECPEDARCHAGLMAEESVCYQPCTDDAGCRDSQHCAEDLLVCVPDCRLGDCSGGLECNFDTGRCDEPYECLPVEEECNQFDDDCDDRIDEGCGPVEVLPAGVGFIDLGLVYLGAGSVQAVEFEIPPGTQSFTLVALADDQSFLTAMSLVDPNGVSLVDPMNPYASINRTMPSEGALTVLVPNAPATYAPPHGKYIIELHKEGDYTLNPVMVFTKAVTPFDTPVYSLFTSPALDGWAQTLTSDMGVASWAHNVEGSVMSAVTSAGPWDIRDDAHKSLLMRSDVFTLPEGASIFFTLAGGAGVAEAPRGGMDANPIASAEDGFMGVALRRVSDGAYLLSKRRSGKNTTRFIRVDMSEEELAAVTAEDANDESYTLDLIDEYHGSCGWLSVGFVAVLSSPLYLDLNLYFVGVDGVDASSYLEHAEFQHLLETFWDVYAQGNILKGKVQAFDITGEDEQKFSFLDKTLTGAGELPELLALSAANPESNALNVFFVSDIANSEELHTLGIAGAIPGPPLFQGSGSSGVVVSTASFYNSEGAPSKWGARVTAQAMAHECGHYLGLFHVTEKTGNAHDSLLDTLECTDTDEDGKASSGECSGKGNDNLMFWVASGRSELSWEQVTVIRSNPQILVGD